MAGSVDLFLNISNGLDENLKKSEKSLSSMGNVAEKVNKSMTGMNKSSNMLNDNYDDIVESSDKAAKSGDRLAGALDKARGFASKMVGSFGLLFGGFQIIDVVSDTIELNQAMSDLSYRMGKAGTDAKDLESAVTGVMIATGASAEKGQEWIIGLREMRVATSDLKELTTAGIQFSEVTGGSEESVRNMIGQLNVMGGLGTKAIKGMIGEIVAVQRAFGLSRGEVDNLTESVTKTTQSLKQMGKNASEIASFSKGVTKLAGAFSSVGISAQSATKFVEDLLDPGQIEDNAFLYAKLGVSMQDAIEGNVDPSKLVGGFKDLGAELKNMSGPAASAMAKSLGMPLNELRQMAEMDMGELEKTFSGMTSATGELSKEQQEQAKTQKDFKNGMEKIKGVFMEIALKAMPTINKIVSWVADNLTGWIDKGKAFLKNFSLDGIKKWGIVLGLAIVGAIAAVFLFKKKFASVNTEIGKNLSKSISSGVEEAFEMSSKKSSAKFAERMKAGTSSYTEDLQRRILEGTDYAAKQSAANYYKTMAGTNLTGSAKKLVESTSVWLDKISAGAKPVSLITKFIDKGNEKSRERIRLEDENAYAIRGAIEAQMQFNQDGFQGSQDRLKHLAAIKHLTAAQTAEQNRLLKDEKIFNKEQEKNTNKLSELENKREARRRSALKNISPIERKNMLEGINTEITRGKTDLIRIDQDKKANQLSLDALNSDKIALGVEQEKLQTAMASGKLSAEAMATAGTRSREIIAAQKVNLSLKAEEEERQISLTNQEKTANDELKKGKANRQDILSTMGDISSEKYEELELQRLGLVNQRETIYLTDKEYKALSEKINKVEKEQLGSLAKVDAGVKSMGFAGKVEEALTAAKNNFVGGVKEGFWKIQDSFTASIGAIAEKFKPGNIRAAISEAGGGNFFKGVGVIFKKGATDFGSALSKAGTVMSKGFKTIGGPMLILAGLIMPLIKGSEGFKKLMEKLKDAFQKLIPIVEEHLMPVFEMLIDALVPLFPIIGEVLAPVLKVVGGLIGALTPIILELVKAALPPLLKVLGNLVMAVGKLGAFMLTLPMRIAAAVNPLGGSFEDRVAKAKNKKAGLNSEDQARLDQLRQEQLNTGRYNMAAAMPGSNLEKRTFLGQAEIDKLVELSNKRNSETSVFGSALDLFKTLEEAGGTLIQTGIDLKEANKDLTGEGDNNLFDNIGTAAGKAVAGLTTKLYPSIIEATSSGFVKTEDARKQIEGDPEAVRKAQQEEANNTLGTIANYMSQLVATGVVSAEKAQELIDSNFQNKKLEIVQ